MTHINTNQRKVKIKGYYIQAERDKISVDVRERRRRVKERINSRN
jgi:hypothetical protein